MYLLQRVPRSLSLYLNNEVTKVTSQSNGVTKRQKKQMDSDLVSFIRIKMVIVGYGKWNSSMRWVKGDLCVE